MRDVVIVPCYERPEYTRICLEYLSRARGIEDKEVWLCQDSHDGGLMINPYDVPQDVHLLIQKFGRLFGVQARWFCQSRVEVAVPTLANSSCSSKYGLSSYSHHRP